MTSCFCRCRRRRIYASIRDGDQAGKELLVLGLKGAGKSYLLRQVSGLARGEEKKLQSLSPTVGVELYDICRNKRNKRDTIKAREVGGCMIPIWPQYFDCAHSLLYVINLSQAETLAAAVTELQQAVLHPHMQAQPACIILTDTTGSSSVLTVPARVEAVNIQHLRDNRTGPIFMIDATQQQELTMAHQVLDWILLP